MQTAKISLAKALKVKNRLAGRLVKVNQDIQSYNSVLLENKEQVNVGKLLETRKGIVAALIELKTALYKGNEGIQQQLYTLGEKKSEIQFLGCISTRDGKERHDYQNTEVVYTAFLKKNDVDEQVKTLEAEIDALQDQVDNYNHTTKIELNQTVLDLAS